MVPHSYTILLNRIQNIKTFEKMHMLRNAFTYLLTHFLSLAIYNSTCAEAYVNYIFQRQLCTLTFSVATIAYIIKGDHEAKLVFNSKTLARNSMLHVEKKLYS